MSVDLRELKGFMASICSQFQVGKPRTNWRTRVGFSGLDIGAFRPRLCLQDLMRGDDIAGEATGVSTRVSSCTLTSSGNSKARKSFNSESRCRLA